MFLNYIASRSLDFLRYPLWQDAIFEFPHELDGLFC
jgi:hypothetical protein